MKAKIGFGFILCSLFSSFSHADENTYSVIAETTVSMPDTTWVGGTLSNNSLYFPSYESMKKITLPQGEVIETPMQSYSSSQANINLPDLSSVMIPYGKNHWLTGSALDDRHVEIWNTDLSQKIKSVELPEACTGERFSFRISESSQYLACGDAVLSLNTGKNFDVHRTGPGTYNDSFFIGDQYYVALSQNYHPDENAIFVSDLATSNVVDSGWDEKVHYIAGPEQGNFIAAVIDKSSIFSDSNILCVMDVKKLKCEQLYKGKINGLRVSPSGHYILISTAEGLLVFEKGEGLTFTQKAALNYTLPPQSNYVVNQFNGYNTLAFKSDHEVFAVTENADVVLLDIATGKELARNTFAKGDTPFSLQYSGDYLAVMWNSGKLDVLKVSQ
ncbi:hypothetical protein ACKC9G_14510 [Pokkaliibacter sp. CJK22405]|uniref:hypothetical protein n=1 Tax=Pokkaliibacter sp. CJK22405 TaxID=3384615 RepID=UPI0039853419